MRVAALGEIFDIARGGSPRPIEQFITNAPNGLNWIKIGDASASGKYIEHTREKIRPEGLSKTRQVEPGDFLLTNSMSFGRPYIMATHGCIHDGWLVLKPKDKQSVHPDYFYYLLGSAPVFAQFASRAGGSTVKNLNSEIVASVEVAFPPLPEQRRIAAILDKADALRRKRQRAVDLLDRLTQSIFLEMFVWAQSPTWPTVSVRSMAIDMRTGPFGSQLLHSEFVSEGVAVLGIDNAVSNEFRWSERRYITTAKYQQLKRYTVRPGDVLITIMGTCGRCAVVPEDIPIAINTKHLCCITLDQAKCLPAFLQAAFLGHPALLKQLGVQAKGAVMPGLNMGIIGKLEVQLPPLDLQIEFAKRVRTIRANANIATKSATVATDFFASLQFRAFTGEL